MGGWPMLSEGSVSSQGQSSCSSTSKQGGEPLVRWHVTLLPVNFLALQWWHTKRARKMRKFTFGFWHSFLSICIVVAACNAGIRIWQCWPSSKVLFAVPQKLKQTSKCPFYSCVYAHWIIFPHPHCSLPCDAEDWLCEQAMCVNEQ